MLRKYLTTSSINIFKKKYSYCHLHYNSYSSSSLSHIKVLDLSRVLAGPWATQHLADLGADVIKVEMPNKGDETRQWGPPFLKHKETNNDSSESAYFLGVNRNKKSITVDFRKPEGQKIIHDLAMKCDVIVENFKVGGLKPYNLDYEFIKGINERIIYCSITGYGQTGPRKNQPGYDFAIQGAGGLMSITGEKDGQPMKVGVAVVDVMTGMYAVSGILSALIYRDKTGIGQHIDISLFDTQLSFLANQGMNYLISGKSPTRLGNQHPNIVPYSSIETKDGHIIIAVGNDKQFKDLCMALEREDLINHELYKTNPLRTKNREKLYDILREEFKKQPKQYWIDKLTTFGVPNSPVNSIEEAFADPQAIHREAKIVMKHAYNDVPLLGNPLKLSESKIEYRLPPPLLGQHTEDILKNFLGKTDEEIEQYKKMNVI